MRYVALKIGPGRHVVPTIFLGELDMLRLADIASSVFAAGFAVALLLGIATVSDLANASEPLTAATCAMLTGTCVIYDWPLPPSCHSGNWCAQAQEGWECQCGTDFNLGPCDCYLGKL